MMQIEIKERVDTRPQFITRKTFALFPKILYFGNKKYFVWLRFYYSDYVLRNGSYMCESDYPIIGNNNSYPLK